MKLTSHANQVATGQRFEFGKNWNGFLRTISEDKICRAVVEIQRAFGVDDFSGMSFLDIGSGSGLSSLAARRLGAKVHSFDYDPQSVRSTELLREKYFPMDKDWTIESGSALDTQYLSSLGKFDIVYSWGVLHHTGAMWTGLENALLPLDRNGLLCIAIYNTQLLWTDIHKFLKRNYNNSSVIGKSVISAVYAGTTVVAGLAADVLQRRNPVNRYRHSGRSRGMSWWHDVVDWAGGYPFETASPDEVFEFFLARGCYLKKLKTCGNRHGCNEFVFRMSPVSDARFTEISMQAGRSLMASRKQVA
jgi:2-polyprenyl-3-methyl-5-hydroxy-6-metoxy-1,4-benzoquinol methylase